MTTPLFRMSACAVAGASIVCVITATLVGYRQPGTPSPEQLTDRVDALFAQWNRFDSPGCGLGISRNGAMMYERGYGMANLDDGIPITPKSVFPLASISKQFTAMAILMLAERRQLSIDDDVRQYVPELPDFGRRITLRHLLTHTSGLRDGYQLLDLAGWRDGDIKTNADEVRILARQKAPNAAPGEEYLYNNSGYTVLAVVVERVSGLSLREFSDANIFKPLGMTDTQIYDDPARIVPNRVSGYYVGARGDGDGFPGNRMTDADLKDLRVANHSPTEPLGADGVYSTIHDLLRWEQNLADGRVGGAALVAAMQAPAVLESGRASFYGFGLQIRPYRGLKTIGHGGSDVGFDLRVLRYPEQGVAIAVLCNLENLASSPLSQEVADIYLADALGPPVTGGPIVPPPIVPLSADQMTRWVGLYRNPSNDDLREVFLRQGKLFATRGIAAGRPSVELRAVSADRFLFPAGTWEFVAGRDGRAQKFREQLAAGGQPRIFEQVKAFAPSKTELSAFAGKYTSPELGVTYAVMARDSGLLLEPSRGRRYLLRPTFTDAFEEGGEMPFTRSIGAMFEFALKITFTRDTRGSVTDLVVHTSHVRGLRLARVKP